MWGQIKQNKKQLLLQCKSFSILNIIIRGKKQPKLRKIFSNCTWAKKSYWEHKLKIRKNNISKREKKLSRHFSKEYTQMTGI